MDKTNGLYRFTLVLLIISLITIFLWFYFFPLRLPFDRNDIFFEGLYLLGVVVGYFFILRLDAKVLEIGWSLFLYGLLIDFLDEFTKEPDVWNTNIPGIITLLGILIVVIGFYFSQRKRQVELAQSRQAEKIIAESEERYRLLAENSLDLIGLLDLEGNVIYFSPSHFQVLGYSPLGPVHNNIFDIIHPDDVETTASAIKNILGSGQSKSVEIRLGKKDGGWVEVEAIISGVADDAGAPDRILISARNITERKKMEKALQKSQERYELAVSSGKVGVWDWDGETGEIYISPNLKTALGFEPHEIHDPVKNWGELVYTDDMKKLRGAANMHLAGLTPRYEVECRMMHKNGGIRWFLIHGNAVRDTGGKPYRMAGVYTDITDRKQVEETLKESERRYKDLFENVPTGVYRTTPDGRVLMANPVLVKMLGYSSLDELISLNLENEGFNAHYPRSQFKEILEREGEVRGLEFSWTRRDGTLIFVRENARAIRGEDGKVLYYEGTLEDITDRKRAEERLQFQSLLLDSVRESVIATDLGGNVTYWSKGAEMLYGYSGQEVIGKPLTFIVEHKNFEEEKQRTRRVIETGSWSGEYLQKRKDGSSFWAQTVISLVKDQNGQPLGLIGIDRDITARRRAEEVLRESEEKYRTLLEHSYDLVIETSMDGRFLYVSPKHREVLGYEPDELIGRSIFERIHPDDRQAVMVEFQRAIVTFTSGYVVYRFGHKNGDWRLLESTGKPFKTASGEIRGIIASRDITEQRRMEEERLRAQKLESLGVLAGGIAHDFNNLLTAILGNISLAKVRLGTEDKTFKRLAEAERACIRASDLTQQLLTFSRGGAPIKRVTLISELIKDSASFVLRGSKAGCEFSVPEDLWVIESDEGQISQVINNLVINADQAMPEGGVIKINAENIIIDDGDGLPIKRGRYVKITVEDQGTGIPEEHLPKIFDPYFTTKQSGSGLGLATTYSIIKNHDGYIGVESKVGVGTKFLIYLPALHKVEKENEDLVKEELLSGVGRVLVMDDEEIIREVAGEMLSKIGYEVEYARDGAEAIEMYMRAKQNNTPFDAVIMDLTIPGGMGGKEAIERLKEIDPQVKAIVSSGYSNDPVMSEFRRYGFSGFVAKPYRIEDLNKTMHEVINQTKEEPLMKWSSF
jgi:PAS domain S-box-containing protein